MIPAWLRARLAVLLSVATALSLWGEAGLAKGESPTRHSTTRRGSAIRSGSPQFQPAPLPATGPPVAAGPEVTAAGADRWVSQAAFAEEPELTVGTGEWVGDPLMAGGPLACCSACAGAPVPCHRAWFRAEYLAWWIDAAEAPPLASATSPTPALIDAGVIGAPGTSVLFGGGSLGDDRRSGYRLEGGLHGRVGGAFGLRFAYFDFGDEQESFAATTDDFPVLARPFLNADPAVAREDSEVVGFPTLAEGNLAVVSELSVDGVGVFLSSVLAEDAVSRREFLFGWATVGVDETLQISDFREIVGPGTALAIGSTVAETDTFETSTRFHGGTVGFSALERVGRATFEGALRLGLGNSSSRATLRGRTVSTTPDANNATVTAERNAGLLVQESNTGDFERSDFAVAPEINLRASWSLTRSVNATVGYNLLYLSQVARAGDQIDRELNLTQLDDAGLVGLAKPEFVWRTTDLLAHGVSVGIDFNY